MDIIREFISTKQFDEQWNSLGLSDNDFKQCNDWRYIL